MTIKLRKLKQADRATLASLANNKKVWDNLRNRMPHPYLEDDAADFISLTNDESPRQNFAIEYKGQLCGVIGILLQHDVYTGTGEIGYWIGEPFWKQGIATQAVGLMTAYGFSELNLRRIYASVFAFNTVSMKVLEKNGYTLEGIRKNAVIKNAVVFDDYCYAITNRQ